jgi:hypothetical protein
MKVPMDRIEDFDPDDPDIEVRRRRWDYWNTLKKIRTEALDNFPEGQFDFSEYVEKNYGIRMVIVDGHITDTFDIVDEKLYTFFLLKWK